MNTFEKIYHIVSTIPKGKVMTYAQVAKLAGVVSPRVVGFAMRLNKDTKQVPCHRVVGSDGTLKGYAYGGIHKKKEVLQKENIPFLDQKTIDLKKCLYSMVSSSKTTSSGKL